MPRKEKSPQEILIAFCMKASEPEIAALVTTMQTIVNVRFKDGNVANAKIRKPRVPKPATPLSLVPPTGGSSAAQPLPEGQTQATQTLGRVQEEAAARSPRTRKRPPVAPVAPTVGDTAAPAVATVGDVPDTLPPQDSPVDASFD